MIVVIEGISASGKSTWCRTHALRYVVPETGPVENSPGPDSDPKAKAAFWTQCNSRRWQAALERESSDGIAVCDTDPLKLHYIWSLWRIGEATQDDWQHQLALTRESLLAGLLGFADLYFISEIDAVTARRRKEGDPTRRRRNFDLHLRLQPALLDWYRTLEAVRPGSVHFCLPNQLPEICSSRGRYDISVFDEMIRRLPC
jgi:hypothetical protein